MTTIHVGKGLSKIESIRKAIRKIETNPINYPFRFTGAIYSRILGQVTFVLPKNYNSPK